MITNKNPASNGQWRESARQLREEYSAALVSGEAYTNYKWQEWDEHDTLEPNISASETKTRARKNLPPYYNRLVSDDEWAELESFSRWVTGGGWLEIRAAQNHGHHSYQWFAKKQLEAAGKDPGNFTAIATDEDARDYRATLELVKRCAVAMRNEFLGSVVNMDIYPKYPLDHVFQEYKNQTILKLLLAPTYNKLSSPMKSVFKMAGMFSKTGIYTTISLNFGEAKLGKYKGKANGRKAWHKRMATALNKALRGLLFSFVVERARGIWHLHMIVYGVHCETFEEQYKAALLQVGGDYTKAAEDHQLVIEGGHGFEEMLGWVGYITKDKDSILYESNELTAAGRELFTYVRAQQRRTEDLAKREVR